MTDDRAQAIAVLQAAETLVEEFDGEEVLEVAELAIERVHEIMRGGDGRSLLGKSSERTSSSSGRTSSPTSRSCTEPFVREAGAERLRKREVAGFAGGHLCDHEVAALDRPLEDRLRMSLRCQRPSRWGRTAVLSLARLGVPRWCGS
jgi:hypothetical protein